MDIRMGKISYDATTTIFKRNLKRTALGNDFFRGEKIPTL